MTEALLALPPAIRERLRTTLRSGFLAPPYENDAVRAELDCSDAEAGAVGEALRGLDRAGVPPAGCAEWLRAFEETLRSVPGPELVWSGPEVPGLHGRATRQVVEELFGGAGRSLMVSSFVFFDGPRAFDRLARRMDETPNLEVTLLLNLRRRRGDLSPEETVRQFADRFWQKDWPGERRPQVFYDPRSLEPEGEGGVLHAKAVVADEETVFVTSANLTEAAFDRNIELGLVVRDRARAVSVAGRFRALIARDLLRPLPDA